MPDPSLPLPSQPSPRLIYDGGGAIDSDTTPWQSSIVSGQLVPPSDPESREEEDIACRVTTTSAMGVADHDSDTTGPCREPVVAVGLETKIGDFVGVFHNEEDFGTPKAVNAPSCLNCNSPQDQEGGNPDPSLPIVTIPHLVGPTELVCPKAATLIAEKDEDRKLSASAENEASACPQAVLSTGLSVSTLYPMGAAVIGLNFVCVPEESWSCLYLLPPVLAPVCKPFVYPCGETELEL